MVRLARPLLVTAIVCVWLLAPSPASADIDCGDVSPSRAQELLDEDPSDPNNLDGDSDGQACEPYRSSGFQLMPVLGGLLLVLGAMVAFSTPRAPQTYEQRDALHARKLKGWSSALAEGSVRSCAIGAACLGALILVAPLIPFDSSGGSGGEGEGDPGPCSNATPQNC